MFKEPKNNYKTLYDEADEYCKKFGLAFSRRNDDIYRIVNALKRAYDSGYNDAERTYGNNN